MDETKRKTYKLNTKGIYLTEIFGLPQWIQYKADILTVSVF